MVEAGVEQVVALLAGSPASEGERSCSGYRQAKQLVSVGQISKSPCDILAFASLRTAILDQPLSDPHSNMRDNQR